MVTDDQMRNTAQKLAERALELCDAKASAVACHLAAAIDVMTDAPIATAENVEAFLASPEGRAMFARWDSSDGAQRRTAH